MRAIIPFLAFVLALSAESAQIKTVTRGDRKIDFVECENCEMFARWSADRTYATINLSRLREGCSSDDELSRRESEMLDRVLSAMSMPASSEETTNRVFSIDGLRGVTARLRGDMTEVTLENADGKPCEFRIPLKSLGFDVSVHVIDMIERAIPPDFDKELFVRVMPNDTKTLLLSKTTK